MTDLYKSLHQPQTNQIQSQGQPQQMQNQLQSSPSNILKTLMNSSNPMDLIEKMASQNPKTQNILSLLKSSKMTPKQFFYQCANSEGVNPDQFIHSLIQQQ